MALEIGGIALKTPLIMAPMAGITGLPFRLLVRFYGAGLAFSEMVSAEGLVRGSSRSFQYLRSDRDDFPLGVQLFGAKPEVMAEAAAIVAARGAALVDINMGCPVRKVTRTGAGAALLTDPPLAGRIIAAVRKVLKLPLTVKIRSGWDRGRINAPEIGRVAQESGADALTIHARTASDGYRGRADWAVIGRVKREIKIPVIGNGDIVSGADAVRMLAETGCDGVMIARGALGNPWIFREGIEAIGGLKPSTVSGGERSEVIARHFRLEAEHFGPEKASRDFLKHILWYTKGLPGASEFRRKVTSLPKGGMVTAVEEFCRRGHLS